MIPPSSPGTDSTFLLAASCDIQERDAPKRASFFKRGFCLFDPFIPDDGDDLFHAFDIPPAFPAVLMAKESST